VSTTTVRPTFTDEVVAALEGGRDLILAGHCHTQAWGILPDGRVAFDALGALARASRISRIFDTARGVLETMLPAGFVSIARYNDASSTAEVSRLYSNAISAVRQAVAA
jgi:hypothetical protein